VATPHQFAAYRIALAAAFALIAVGGVGLDSLAPEWLELARGFRFGVRGVSAAAALALALGWQRRLSAAALGLGALALCGLGALPTGAAIALLLHVGLVSWPARGEPWRLASGADFFQLPKHWSRSAWFVCTGSVLLAGCGPLTTAALAPVAAISLLASGYLIWKTSGSPSEWPSRGLQLALLLLLLASVAASLFGATWCWPLLVPNLLAVASPGCLPGPNTAQTPTVYFDGVCGLCQSSVRLILQEDTRGKLQFAPLQGETAAQQLSMPIRSQAPSNPTNPPDPAPESLVLQDGPLLLRRSDAALQIAMYLGGVWSLLRPLSWLPVPVRDAAYNWIAGNRYAWFGKLEACPLPPAWARARFRP
jgi:predicted DCC family thiol-disulfide oxidoreductase YuxK